MFLHIFSIIAPILVCAGIGYAWSRSGRPYDTAFVTRIVMNVGAPFLIVSSFQKATVGREALASVGIASVLVTFGVATLAWIVLRLFRADVRAFLPPVAFQNTGNMGMPLCLFAFGADGLSLAIMVFMWVSTANFTVGVALASGERNLTRVLRTPLVWATLAALLLSALGIHLPAWIRNTADLLGGLTIPMMLIALGAALSSLRVQALGRSLGLAAMRFVFGFGMGILVSHLLGLSGVVRGVVVLQASMPAAVFNYLIAARYGRREEDVAGAVVVSTLFSFAILPLVLWYLL